MEFEKHQDIFEIQESRADLDCGVACTGSGDNNTFATKSKEKKRSAYKGERKTCDCN